MNRFDPIASLASMRHEIGAHGGVNMSIEASSTFTVTTAGVLPAICQGRMGPEGGCYVYGRHVNPTVSVLGRQLAALEGAQAAYCTASGMSAISATVMQLCDRGDHMVSADTIYGGTFALLRDFLPRKAGLDVTFVDITDPAAVEAAITARTKLIYCESMSNPTLRVPDIPRLAELAHARGLKLVVDNTFTPLIMSPVRLGADVVVHSLTKFASGASDVIAGAICGTTEFVTSLTDLHMGSLMLLGPTMDPKVAFEISLRLPHLGLRMAEHSRRAQIFAERLADAGLPVIYPGLPGHPDRELLGRLGNPEYGSGGVLCVDLGSVDRAGRFMELLQNQDRFGFMAVSLGYFDTLMSCPAATTSSEMGEEEMRKTGITPGLLRISVGYTGSVEQRWRQMNDALAELGVASPAV
jgi:methionine-gamma-lyase